MWFKCDACACKDAHIADLRAEIASLRAQLIPTPVSQYANVEANAILSGSPEVIEIEPNKDKINEDLEIEAEFKDILLSV